MRYSLIRITLSLASALPLAAALAAAAPAGAADWPAWRGPDHNGISRETKWISAWPAGGPKVLWRAKVGTGYSSFAVAGGRAYTMGNTHNKDTVFCFDAATGRTLWSHTYGCPLDAKYHDGGTNATPTVDGGSVYTLSKRGHVFCLDAATGKVRWSRTLTTKPPTWGYAGSARVFGETIILNCGSAGLALDKATGKDRWQSGTGRSGYSTAMPLTWRNQPCMALFLEKTVAVVQAADGKKLWEAPWRTRYDVNAADPIFLGQQMFISSGYNRGCAMFDLSAGSSEPVWQGRQMRNHFNSCVLIDGHLYGVDEKTLKCLKWKTGETVWSKEGLGKGALMAAAGKLIIMADNRGSTRGMLKIAQASPAGYKELASAKVLSGRSRCWTTPILSGGRIYCRETRGDVACVDVSGK